MLASRSREPPSTPPAQPCSKKWERLEALLDRYMTPAMAEAGFGRTDGQYRISSAVGDLVVVDVRGSTPIPELSFFIEWAAIPKALRDFHSGGNSVEAIGDWDPAFLAARRAQLLGFEAFGERFEQVLRASAVPLWLNALDRHFLARPEWARFYLGGRPSSRPAVRRSSTSSAVASSPCEAPSPASHCCP